MDMSFAGQALASEHMWKNRGELENKVYSLPAEIDENIAALKLAALGVKTDILSQEQQTYLNSWEEGT
jgi:adenosylhomocysteinase